MLLYAVIHLLGSIVIGYYSYRRIRDHAFEGLDDRLRSVAHSLRPWIVPRLQGRAVLTVDDEELASRLEATAGLLNIHIELLPMESISPDDDSQIAANIEVASARQGGTGFATRLAPGTQIPTRFLALAMGPDANRLGFLRVSAPLSSAVPPIGKSISMFATFSLLSLILGLVAVSMIANRASSHLRTIENFIGGIAAGDFANVLPTTISESGWSGLGRLLTQMQTDLKQRYQKLSGNNDRLAGVLMSMSEGVLTIDQRRRVVLANRAALGLLDVSQRDILQRPFYEVVRNPMVEQCIEEVFRTHRSITREIESTRGAQRMLSMRFSWLPNPSVESVVLVVHDVTNIRLLETMRRDFVANVSHELKTPLASIKAYSETLRLGAIEDEQNRLRFVERIEEQANRLNELIMDLIQLARIEAGQATFELEDIDLCTVAKQRVDAFQDDAVKRRTKLTFESSGSPIIAHGDEDGIITILDNLITNAIRYTPEEATVLVRVSASDSMGILEVIDNGQGIAPEHHERIFERFYRVDRARSRDLGGTGLGLSIVKHLSQAMGGKVELISRLGRGCCFRVSIPLR